MEECLITKKHQAEQLAKYGESFPEADLLKVYERHDIQSRFEGKLLSKMVTCSTVMNDVLRLPGVDLKQLEAITSSFYHPGFGQQMTCLANALYLDDKTLGLKPDERLRNNLEVSPLGKGVSGITLAASLRNATKIFALKVPLDQSDHDRMAHEAVVGLFGTNKLRAYCPNFSLVYGFFRCSPPVVSSDEKKILTWCNKGDESSVGYVIYELIESAQSLSEFIRSGASTIEILELYLQVMFALRVGRRINFTHYDLHAENIVLRPILTEGAFYIPYIEEDAKNTRYVRSSSRRVATIIDYGKSYFETVVSGTKVALGAVGDPIYEYSIFDDRPFFIHDAYKLLCTMLQDGRMFNPIFYQEAKTLLHFWNPCQDADTIIKEQAPFFYAVPEVAAEYRNFDEWVEYCVGWLQERKYEGVVVNYPAPESHVLQCFPDCPEFKIFPTGSHPSWRLTELVDYTPLISPDQREIYLPLYRSLLENIAGEKDIARLRVPSDPSSLAMEEEGYAEVRRVSSEVILRLQKIKESSSQARYIAFLKVGFQDSDDLADLVAKRLYYDVKVYEGEFALLERTVTAVLDKMHSPVSQRLKEINRLYSAIRVLIDDIAEDLSGYEKLVAKPVRSPLPLLPALLSPGVSQSSSAGVR